MINNNRSKTALDSKNKASFRRLLIPLIEAAEMLSVSRQTVMNYVQRGQLQCVRPAPRSVFFRPADLETFVEDHIEHRTPLDLAA
ncbi:helix-turn-helix domain protein [bacterium BMS3Bbin04]|nr:helix-turn-helix domain protein [bacterium BMS3Bbin04]